MNAPINLSQHFTLDELVFSSTAVRLGIDNSAPQEVATNLATLAVTLEKVRDILGNNPMHIDSGYRCEALNKAVGGVPSSAHVIGFAADFICAAFGQPPAIVRALANSGISFDQLIEEGTWVHISVDPRMRGQVLTAQFTDGIASYTQGVRA